MAKLMVVGDNDVGKRWMTSINRSIYAEPRHKGINSTVDEYSSQFISVKSKTTPGTVNYKFRQSL